MKRKVRYSSVMIIGIFVYIIINIVSGFFRASIDTQSISSEKVEESITTKGLVIRDEYLIKANMNGNIDRYLKDGDKIKKEDDIVRIHNNNINNETIKDLEVLESEVQNIEKGNTELVKKDIDKINNEIEKNSLKMQNKLINEQLLINEEIENLDKLIIDKNNILKSDLNSKSIKNKEEEITKISNLIEKNSIIAKTNKSGIVSYKYDGNEEKFNIDSIKNLTKEDIVNTENKYEEIENGDKISIGEPIARIVNNTKQYISIAIDDKEVKHFKTENNVNIVNGKSNIKAKVYDIAKRKNENIVTFEISEQNIEIYDTRVAEFDIIYKSIEGIKIPKDCIVEKDKARGVYIVSETGNAKFVEIQGISYENEEFLVIDYYNNKINGIKTIDIYDEIILQPKKVREGSIVK